MFERQDARIEYREISSLKPFDANARTHSKKQIHQISASIREFGFTNPVLIDQENRIIAGHGRVAAAKLLCMRLIPTIQIEHLNEAQKRAYLLADNKIAQNAGWDPEILRLELQFLSAQTDLEIEITGFETAEIDNILQHDRPIDPADNTPPRQSLTITKPNDVWLLGEHKILCGDARDKALCGELMGSERARLMFTDPPYNVPIDGHVGGLGLVKHREFAMAAGEMTRDQFKDFLTTVLTIAAQASLDGALHYICMDWRHVGEITAASQGIYSEFKNLCVWNKDNGGMGSFYRSKHELVFVFKVGTAAHLNNIELGKTGRYRTNVWDYPGVNTMKKGRLQELSMHPTVKPVGLVADAIRDCSRRGEIVFDPFGGSGTTMIAAEKTSRRARLVEIDCQYVDVSIRRWQSYTRGSAILSRTGQAFDEIEAHQRST
jgi:DNA modification methylase